MVCVDASLLIALVIDDHPAELAADQLLVEWQHDQEELVAPTLCRFELCNGIHRYVCAGALSGFEADRRLARAISLIAAYFPCDDLHFQAAALARSLGLPATYDAHYLALAQRLGCDFWTADARLFNTVSSQLPWVRLAGVS